LFYNGISYLLVLMGIRLAASIALEENDKLVNNALTSVGASTVEEEEVDYDEDEEMILVSLYFETYMTFS